MGEAIGGHVRGGAARPGGSIHHGALGNHLDLFLFFSFPGPGGAVDAPTTFGEHGVVAPAPIDAIGGRGREE